MKTIVSQSTVFPHDSTSNPTPLSCLHCYHQIWWNLEKTSASWVLPLRSSDDSLWSGLSIIFTLKLELKESLINCWWFMSFHFCLQNMPEIPCLSFKLRSFCGWIGLKFECFSTGVFAVRYWSSWDPWWLISFRLYPQGWKSICQACRLRGFYEFWQSYLKYLKFSIGFFEYYKVKYLNRNTYL